MQNRSVARPALLRELPVWLLFILASAAAMMPVLKNPGRIVIGWTGDNLQFIYMVGWMIKALRTGQPLLTDPQLNFPAGLPLATTDTPFLGVLLLAPIGWISSEVFVYNLLIFLSCVLSGWFTYLWVKDLTGSRFAGALAGLIFLWTPYRIAHSYGHLHLVSTQFIPLFFHILHRVLQRERPALKDAGFLGLAVLLVGASSQYYLVICLTCALVYTIFSRPEIRYLLRQGWKLAASGLMGGLISAIPYLLVWNEDGFKHFPILSTRPGSANLVDYFLPSRMHAIWGAWIESINPTVNWIEYTHYLGLAGMVLAFVAIFWRESPYRRLVRTWIAVLIFAFIMSLGTDLHLMGGKPLSADNPFWLPAYYFGQLPLIGIMRVWSRFSIVVLLFVALLAGLGISRLESMPWFSPVWKFALLALVAVDLLPGRLASSQVSMRPIDRWIAAQPGDFSLAFVPNTPIDNYYAIYASLSHEKRMPAYIHPDHLPRSYKRYLHAIQSFPDDTAILAIRRMGIRYLILQPAYFDGDDHPSWQSVEASLDSTPRLAAAARVDEYTIYEFLR